jgi:hypothetical protein
MPLFRRKPAVPPIELEYDSTHGNGLLRDACLAANRDDWAPASDLMVAAGTDHDARSTYAWALADALAEGPVSGIGQVDGKPTIDTQNTWADRWVAEDPGNVDAHLVRLRSLIARAWQVRGSGQASSVSEAEFDEFHRVLRMLLPLCHEAAEVGPGDPGVWSPMIIATQALAAPRDVMERFWAKVVERDPHHREAHNFKLSYLCKKWQGSHEEMYAFARGAAAAAPAGSSLHILPVDAHAEYLLYAVGFTSSKADRRAMFVAWSKDKQVQRDIDNAFENWFRHGNDKHPSWYRDLNLLAYLCYWTDRYRDAKPVFEAIGNQATKTPWVWAGDPETKFLETRAKALTS